MKKLLSLVLLTGFMLSQQALAGNLKQFIKLKSGRELYVETIEAKAGKPTIVLLNGLTYGIKQWDRFSKALETYGYGQIKIDPFGMGQTLLKYAPMMEVIPADQQVKDIHEILQSLNVPTPYNLLGLSYGGGLSMIFASTYPSEVGTQILMAPYTEPMEGQDTWIKSQITYSKQVNPFLTASEEELYDYFLKWNVYTTYPSAEPIVLENPYKLEATFRMVQGIRHWKASDHWNNFADKSVHLIIAGMDQYIKREVLTTFWDKLPESKKLSKVIINNSEHKIPEAVPNFAAAWVDLLMRDKKLVSEKVEFNADPLTGEVLYKDGKLQLTKEY